MAEKTKEEWDKMSWDNRVAHRVNNHHDRIQKLEEQVAKLMKQPPLRTVDDLAGNNRKINE